MGQVSGVAKLPEKPSAYSYVRMSTDVQLRGDSRRRQLEESRRFALERGLQLVEDFEDLGVSAYRGKNVSDGALERMLPMDRTRARYFTVRFKDGSLRIVVPNPDDPLQFDIQIAG